MVRVLALSVAMFMARFMVIVLAMFCIGYRECCILDECLVYG